ncbi:MAG: hypothetical protein GWN87_31375 [Desulfuromonadales bacterium]|nr:hypothetical protein [Desulfuromonadales bacterium]NIS44043.1 hypothetical protein [Desulfuromonadales bacterium]
MTARTFFALLAALVFTGWGTAFAANHGAHRPDFRGAPAASQHRPATPGQPTVQPQQQQQPEAAELNENASPIAEAATENAGQGTGTADAVKGAIEEETGQDIPEEADTDDETLPDLPDEAANAQQ